jgi:hypothetical protein
MAPNDELTNENLGINRRHFFSKLSVGLGYCGAWIIDDSWFIRSSGQSICRYA